MSVDWREPVAILGSIWLLGLSLQIYAYIKTKTKPGQLSNKELYERAFGLKDDDKTNGNNNNPST